MDLSNSDSFRNRDLLDAVIQKKEEQQKYHHQQQQQQLQQSSDPVRLANLLQRTNGELSRPSSFISKRSTALSQSQEQLSEIGNINTDEVESLKESISRTVMSLALLSVSSLILAALDLQLLIQFARRESAGISVNDTLLHSKERLEDITEVGTAFATFGLVLETNCLLVCSMQCFFATKILKVIDGSERAAKYLRECASSRFIAVIGFFVSLPAFLITVVLYAVLRLKYSPAIIATVILSFGVLFAILCVMQNCYHWYVELSRANNGLPVYDGSQAKQQEKKKRDNHLNTLV